MAKFKHTERTVKIYNSIIKEYREINSDSDLEAIGIAARQPEIQWRRDDEQ